jgi:hypothetical protein
MFTTNFKSSVLVLPWLLLPLAVDVFFATVVDRWIQENGYARRSEMSLREVGRVIDETIENIDEELEYNEDDGSGTFEDAFGIIEDAADELAAVYRWTYSNECFNISTAAAILMNFLFLLIVPCAFGGFDPGIKRGQFYLGFFLQLAALVALPLTYFLVYELDNTTLVILLGLHAVSFAGTYIIGSRFVSPAYRRAFWFA